MHGLDTVADVRNIMILILLKIPLRYLPAEIVKDLSLDVENVH